MATKKNLLRVKSALIIIFLQINCKENMMSPSIYIYNVLA